MTTRRHTILAWTIMALTFVAIVLGFAVDLAVSSGNSAMDGVGVGALFLGGLCLVGGKLAGLTYLLERARRKNATPLPAARAVPRGRMPGVRP